MKQDRLFSLPPAYAITIRLEVDGTWSLVIAKQTEFGLWDERDRSTYEKLSLAEAIDVLAVELLTA